MVNKSKTNVLVGSWDSYLKTLPPEKRAKEKCRLAKVIGFIGYGHSKPPIKEVDRIKTGLMEINGYIVQQ